MRLISPLLILLLSVPLFGQTLEKKIAKFDKPKDYKFQYDKFKDETNVYSNEFLIKKNKQSKFEGVAIAARVSFIFSGQEQSHDNGLFWLTLSSYSSQWQFLRAHRLIALVDGQRIDLGNGAHEGSIGRYATVTESVHYGISRQDLEMITNGKSVEIQYGPFEGTLDEKTLRILKNMFFLGTAG